MEIRLSWADQQTAATMERCGCLQGAAASGPSKAPNWLEAELLDLSPDKAPASHCLPMGIRLQWAGQATKRPGRVAVSPPPGPHGYLPVAAESGRSRVPNWPERTKSPGRSKALPWPCRRTETRFSGAILEITKAAARRGRLLPELPLTPLPCCPSVI